MTRQDLRTRIAWPTVAVVLVRPCPCALTVIGINVIVVVHSWVCHPPIGAMGTIAMMIMGEEDAAIHMPRSRRARWLALCGRPEGLMPLEESLQQEEGAKEEVRQDTMGEALDMMNGIEVVDVHTLVGKTSWLSPSRS